MVLHERTRDHRHASLLECDNDALIQSVKVKSEADAGRKRKQTTLRGTDEQFQVPVFTHARREELRLIDVLLNDPAPRVRSWFLSDIQIFNALKLRVS